MNKGRTTNTRSEDANHSESDAALDSGNESEMDIDARKRAASDKDPEAAQKRAREDSPHSRNGDDNMMDFDDEVRNTDKTTSRSRALTQPIYRLSMILEVVQVVHDLLLIQSGW